MKEQLVTFETAKLAKEKGFDEGSKNVWHQDGQYTMTSNSFFRDNGASEMRNSKGFIEAPNQSLLQKWLREKYDIHLSAFPVVKNRYYFTISKIKEDGIDAIIKGPYDPKTACDTYEQALEKGLIEALNKI